MLVTFLQGIMCVISGLNACRLTPKLLNTIQTPNAFQQGNVKCYNLKCSQEYFQPKINKKALAGIAILIKKSVTQVHVDATAPWAGCLS